MNTQTQALKQIDYLRQHGVTVQLRDDGRLNCLSQFTINGVGGSEWEVVEPTREAVRSWLGY